MNTMLLPNLLDVSFCLVALFIAVRSFDIYASLRQSRLFILGLSMLLVSLSTAADFTASYVKVVPLHTDWFLYIGQAVGFLFILLSLVRGSDGYLRTLMNLNMLAFALLLIPLLASAVLPPLDPTARALFGIVRLFSCLFILIAYFWAYTNKPTFFSLLMTGAFFFFTVDYMLSITQYFVSDSSQYLLRNAGDITGVISLIMLVAAVSLD